MNRPCSAPRPRGYPCRSSPHIGHGGVDVEDHDVALRSPWQFARNHTSWGNDARVALTHQPVRQRSGNFGLNEVGQVVDAAVGAESQAVGHEAAYVSGSMELIDFVSTTRVVLGRRTVGRQIRRRVS